MEYIDFRQALVDYLTQKGFINDVRVKQAVEHVPRHLFVDVDPWEAYSNQAIKLKEQNEQVISTISQPAVVVHMLELLDIQPGQRILEIGAGSGYNAALLSMLTGSEGHVLTVEYDSELAVKAEANLKSYANVTVVRGDGRYGNAIMAPFDRIVVTVQANDVFTAWQTQLVNGGIVLLPLEYRPGYTRLLKLVRSDQVYTGRFGWAVNFVPMAGEITSNERNWVTEERSIKKFIERYQLHYDQRDAFCFYYSWAGLPVQEAWTKWLELGQPQPEDFLVSTTIDDAPRIILPSLEVAISLQTLKI